MKYRWPTIPKRLDPKSLFRKDSTVSLSISLLDDRAIETKFSPLRDPVLVSKYFDIIAKIVQHNSDDTIAAVASDRLLADRFDSIFKACCPEFAGDYVSSVLGPDVSPTADIGNWWDLNPKGKVDFLNKFLEQELM